MATSDLAVWAAISIFALFASGLPVQYIGLLTIVGAAAIVWYGQAAGEGQTLDRWGFAALTAVAAMTIWHTAAPVFNVDLLWDFKYYRTVLGALLGFVLIVYVPRLCTPKQALSAIVWAAVVVAIVWSIFPKPITSSSNAIAELLACGFVAGIIYYDLTKDWFVLIAVGMTGAAVAVSGARASVIASAIAVALWVVYRQRETPHFRVALAGALVSIVAGVVFVASPLPKPAIVNGFTFNGRIELWSAALSAIIESPLGNGFGEGARYAAGWGWYDTGINSAHNAYLAMGAVFGVPALLGYVGLYSRALQVGTRRGVTPHYAAFACLLAALVITQLFYANPVFISRGGGVIGGIALGFLIRETTVNSTVDD